MDRVCRLACAERPPRPGDDARLELADEGGRLRGSGGRPLGRPGSPAWAAEPALAAAGPAEAPASIAAPLVVTGEGGAEQLAAAAGAPRGATEAYLAGEPVRLCAGAPQALPWPCLSGAGGGIWRLLECCPCTCATRGPITQPGCSRLHLVLRLHGSKVAHGVSCAPPAYPTHSGVGPWSCWGRPEVPSRSAARASTLPRPAPPGAPPPAWAA